jgi:hypothetical protein
MPLINKIAFGAWGLVAICAVLWALEMYEPDFSSVYEAAASQGAQPFRVSDVSCVVLDRKRVIFDQKEYIDPKLPEAVTDVLLIKSVILDSEATTCPWHLSLTGISGRNYNVSYRGNYARYLISVGICERKSDDQASSKCLSKEIYVFNRNIEPHKLFLLALVGFAKSQAAEWESYQVKKDAL